MNSSHENIPDSPGLGIADYDGSYNSAFLKDLVIVEDMVKNRKLSDVYVEVVNGDLWARLERDFCYKKLSERTIGRFLKIYRRLGGGMTLGNARMYKTHEEERESILHGATPFSYALAVLGIREASIYIPTRQTQYFSDSIEPANPQINRETHLHVLLYSYFIGGGFEFFHCPQKEAFEIAYKSLKYKYAPSERIKSIDPSLKSYYAVGRPKYGNSEVRSPHLVDAICFYNGHDNIFVLRSDSYGFVRVDSNQLKKVYDLYKSKLGNPAFRGEFYLTPGERKKLSVIKEFQGKNE